MSLIDKLQNVGDNEVEGAMVYATLMVGDEGYVILASMDTDTKEIDLHVADDGVAAAIEEAIIEDLKDSRNFKKLEQVILSGN